MNNFSILIAEDERLLQKNLESKIQSLALGFAPIRKADNGAQALASIQSCPPDILLTDIKMPQMDGMELIQAVSKGYPYIKIVIISGFAEFEFAKQALLCGAFNYILKPVKLAELEETLSQLKITLCAERNIDSSDCPTISTNTIAQAMHQAITSDFAKELDFSAFAAEWGISPAYLTKIFSKAYGTTPMKFLIEIRINKAKHLLLHSDLSIKAVGGKIGYDDQFYFSKLFKQLTGKSPAQYRQAQHNSQPN